MGLFKKSAVPKKPTKVGPGGMLPAGAPSMKKPTKVGPGGIRQPTKVGPGGIRQLLTAGAPSMKEGGMVAKTMLHHLHKGEMVVPTHLVKHFSKLMSK